MTDQVEPRFSTPKFREFQRRRKWATFRTELLRELETIKEISKHKVQEAAFLGLPEPLPVLMIVRIPHVGKSKFTVLSIQYTIASTDVQSVLEKVAYELVFPFSDFYESIYPGDKAVARDGVGIFYSSVSW